MFNFCSLLLRFVVRQLENDTGCLVASFLEWEKKERNCCHSFCFDRLCLEINSTVTSSQTHNALSLCHDETNALFFEIVLEDCCFFIHFYLTAGCVLYSQ